MTAPQSPEPQSIDNRTGYDRWAESYDGYVNSTVAADDMAFPPMWAHVRGQRVLEIGCGTGRHTLRLAQAGNQVTGLDLSPGMLAVARRKLAGFDVELIEADILKTPMTGFDVVVTALVLEHIGALDAFFGRVAAALVPGGEAYLSEIHPDRIAAGTQANFVDATGEAVRLTSYAHRAEDIVMAADAAGLQLISHEDVMGGDALVARNADWERHRGRAMLRMWHFSRVDATG